MKLGMVGLGKMGSNMTKRLLRNSHDIIVYDHDINAMREIEKEGAKFSLALDDLVNNLQPIRVIWVMLPAGRATEETIDKLSHLLSPGDIIIDGGNTYFKDDVARSTKLSAQKIHYIDVGTSGGIWGLDRGYCMTIGGAGEIVEYLDPLFRALGPTIDQHDRVSNGYLHVGPAGAGHFVKMIHNGIEYGMMQAFAEGMEILRESASEQVEPANRYDLDLHKIAEVWRHGSVVSSWLLDLLEIALREDKELSNYSGYVQDSGEGRWTVQTAIEEDVPASVLTASLFSRFHSRQDNSFGARVLSALRHQFGGHKEHKKPENNL